MAHVTIIGKRSEQEIREIRDHYEKMGFEVTVVENMSEAVDGVMKTLREWK